MIQSIGDYENWRDKQYDHPQPDDGPDERSIRFYSHDYPADTTLEYTRTGDHSELRLSFSSEDPDSGTEELIYVSESGKSMQELTADLKEELAAYLDATDTSSFYQQQGIPQPDGMRSQIDYSEYSRTSLYSMMPASKYNLSNHLEKRSCRRLRRFLSRPILLFSTQIHSTFMTRP